MPNKSCKNSGRILSTARLKPPQTPHWQLWSITICPEQLPLRVADLKTRRSCFGHVGNEEKISPAQHSSINEILHPRIEEIADTLHTSWGRWRRITVWAQACLRPWTSIASIAQSSSICGYLLLYAIVGLRTRRQRSLRFGIEQQHISDWLANITALAALQLEVARTQPLVKGYGDTPARGWRILDKLTQLQNILHGAAQLAALASPAFADDRGQAQWQILASAS